MMEMIPDVKSFQKVKEQIRSQLYEIYPADSVDYINQTIRGQNPGFAHSRKNIESPLTLISSFLGLPNRPLGIPDGDKQTFLNLLRNFVGWQPKTSKTRLFFYALFITPLNIITTPLKFALNIAKLATEVLPMALHKLLPYLGTHVVSAGKWMDAKGNTVLDIGTWLSQWHQEPDRGMLAKLAGLAGWVIAKTVGLLMCASSFPLKGLGFLAGATVYPLHFLHFIGRSITSPIDSIRDTLATKGNLYAGLHSLLIMVIYAVGFPLLAKGLSATVIPYLSTHLPSGIVSAVNSIANAVAPLLTKIGSYSLPVIISKAASFLHLPGFAATLASPVINGLATIAGMVAVTSVAVNDKVNSFREFWHKQRSPVEEEDSLLADDEEDEVELYKGHNPWRRLGPSVTPNLKPVQQVTHSPAPANPPQAAPYEPAPQTNYSL